jgi:hypothetical protein
MNSELIKRVKAWRHGQPAHDMLVEVQDALEAADAQIDALQDKVHLCAAYDAMEAKIAKLEAALEGLHFHHKKFEPMCGLCLHEEMVVDAAIKEDT